MTNSCAIVISIINNEFDDNSTADEIMYRLHNAYVNGELGYKISEYNFEMITSSKEECRKLISELWHFRDGVYDVALAREVAFLVGILCHNNLHIDGGMCCFDYNGINIDMNNLPTNLVTLDDYTNYVQEHMNI